MLRTVHNAVLVPYRAGERLILIQDRRGHKPPPWGFFGGGIERGETPVQAVLREAQEELGVKLREDDLEPHGPLFVSFRDLEFTLHLFLWRFDGTLSELTLGEGAGMELVTPEKMKRRTEPGGPDHLMASRLGEILGAG